MPWLPEVFTAPVMEEILEKRRRHALVAVPYFDGLLAGDPEPLVESFAGEPEVHDPVRGRVSGEAAFRAFVVATHAWLQEHRVTVDDVEYVVHERHGFEEVVLHVATDRGPVDLPVAVVADRLADGRIEEVRVYFSTVPLTGRRTSRPPLLQPDPDLGVPDDVTAALDAFYDQRFGSGSGFTVEPCALVDGGRAFSLEHNVRWSGATQAAIACLDRDDGGQIATLRVCGGLRPPVAQEGWPPTSGACRRGRLPVPAVERRVLARLPGLAEPRSAQVPVGPDLAEDVAQVVPEVDDGRTAPEPVAVVDAVDHQPGLEHQRVRDHRVVVGVGVLLDVQVLLDDAARVGQEGPLGADRRAELLEGVVHVGRDGRDLGVAHRDLRVERRELLVLLVLLRAVVPPREREDHRVVTLEVAEPAGYVGVVGQLVVGERRSGDDVGSHGRPLGGWVGVVSRGRAAGRRRCRTSPRSARCWSSGGSPARRRPQAPPRARSAASIAAARGVLRAGRRAATPTAGCRRSPRRSGSPARGRSRSRGWPSAPAGPPWWPR